MERVVDRVALHRRMGYYAGVPDPREVLALLEVFRAQWLIVELPARTLNYMDMQRQFTGEGPVQVI